MIATQLNRALQAGILIMDGAMGTAVQACALGAEDYNGASNVGCHEILNVTRPDIIRRIHADYLSAGADIIETNSFGGTSIVLAEYGLSTKAYQYSLAAAQLAREVADEWSTPQKPRFVAGSMGPTTKAISLSNTPSFEQLADIYQEQAEALIAGGVDYLLLETAHDTRNIKAGLAGIRRACNNKHHVPVAISITIQSSGTMLAGQDVAALLASFDHLDLLYIGINCATGPQMMTNYIRTLAEKAPWPVACVPNAGLPDEEGHYNQSPEQFADALRGFADKGWLNVAGGCCGTNQHHIKALAASLSGVPSRCVSARRGLLLSGLQALDITGEKRPIIVGERTNVIGSRRFREMIAAERWEDAAEVARRQVRSGAQVIDICLANPDRDELADMHSLLSRVARLLKVPLMIDSTDPAVIERALTWSQGRAVINSVNLEDGGERLACVARLAREYGAALVVGVIDEKGMALTRQRKLEVAQRAFRLLVEEHGLRPTDLIFDPLTFPCASGDKQYMGCAQETIEGVRQIKEALPQCATILGISNISFGLPLVGREVVNNVFLHYCTLAGLDMAIVNAESLRHYASITDTEKELAYNLLFNTDAESIECFTGYFRKAPSSVRSAIGVQKSVDERLADHIIQGSREGLFADLQLALQERTPLDVINGPLMSGMATVGRMFNNNELIVAEVLQSAEVMKAAVNWLEEKMPSGESTSRGTIVLATVKGDVHDIGKNLVHIIFSNNGFKVIDLGTKVEPERLVQVVCEQQPDMVGLSGLLVRSAHEMVTAASALTKSGVCPPLLVGGAALSENFTRRRIAPQYKGIVVYAADAMKGLELANRIMDPTQLPLVTAEWVATNVDVDTPIQVDTGTAKNKVEGRSSQISILTTLPEPPDYERHVLKRVDLEEVWQYLDEDTLYSRHLGLHGRFSQLRKTGDEKARQLAELVEAAKEYCRENGMHVDAIFQFFKANSNDACIYLGTQNNDNPVELCFPRQPVQPFLSLADYVHPVGGPVDSVAMFVVSAGSGVADMATRLRNEGAYQMSHTVSALALATAEAAAEWLHAHIRKLWGFSHPADIKRGRRYSFGYSACPDLTQQTILFDLLKPAEIGVSLTEQMMMDPEATVSAMAFHHPECRYFNVPIEGTVR